MYNNIPKDVPEYFELDPELKVSPETVAMNGVNPFICNSSSPRSYMFGSQFTQVVVLNSSEERIVTTGVEHIMGAEAFTVEVEKDSEIIAIVPRGIPTDPLDITIIYREMETGLYDLVVIPKYHSLHKYFGFEYKWDMERITDMVVGRTIVGGTILATTPGRTENNGYGFGLNLNTCMMSHPDVAEDAVIISDVTAEKCRFNIFTKIVAEYGPDKYPLNLYGDEKVYKTFPEVGEYVRDDGVVLALRNTSKTLAPCLSSRLDNMTYDPRFDEVQYVKDIGDASKVIDVKVYHSPKNKREPYSGTCDEITKYSDELVTYHKKLLAIYDKLNRSNRSGDLVVGNEFNRVLVYAQGVTNDIKDHRIIKSYRKELLNIYRIEITLQSTVIPKSGFKFTGINGDKGVNATIRPQHLMPKDKNGVYADILMDHISTSSRLNIGRLYEQYVSGASMVLKDLVLKTFITDQLPSISRLPASDFKPAFGLYLELLKLIGDIQYDEYSKMTNLEDIKELICHCIKYNFTILFRVDNNKRAYRVIPDIYHSKFAPLKDNIMLIDPDTGKVEVSDAKIIIAPLYHMLVNKTGDTYLSTASSKMNHFGFPVSENKQSKNKLPWNNTPTKVLGETETRTYLGYVGREFTAEFKDRGTSLESQRLIHNTLLTSPDPMNIPRIIDRDKHPLGTDKSLALIDSIFNVGGTSIEYD